MERRRWRKAQRAGVQKEEDFLPLGLQETCLEILDEDGSWGFDAKGKMNELVKSSKRRKH
jgi:hypothetical protein